MSDTPSKPPLSQTLVTRLCCAVLAGYAVLLYSTAGQNQGWPGTGRSVQETTDYVAIWTAGRQTLAGHPLEAYDWQLHKDEASKLLGTPPPGYLPWPYPPIFLGVAALFALLPYGASMLVWVIATWAAAAAAGARIIGSSRGALWMSVSVGALYNANCGQNGALSAALFGFGLVFIPTRPILAGMCLGALAYKPHLGLLIPIALAAAGYWRVFASAAATVAVLVIASALAFGPESWPAFFAQTAKMAAYIAQVSNPEKLQSLFGVLRSLGASAGVAVSAQSVLAATVAVFVATVWRRDVPYEIKAAALVTGTVLVSPYFFIYDLAVLMVAQAFLIRQVIAGRFDEREIDGIVVANALIALYPATGFPTGFIASLVMMALVVRRLKALEPAGALGFEPAFPRLLQGKLS